MEDYTIELYERFSFDKFFKLLLSKGIDTEEALEIILNNSKLSALVYQERIENEFYKLIKVDTNILDDLKEIRQKVFDNFYPNKN